jgi:hypothetical protein
LLHICEREIYFRCVVYGFVHTVRSTEPIFESDVIPQWLLIHCNLWTGFTPLQCFCALLLTLRWLHSINCCCNCTESLSRMLVVLSADQQRLVTRDRHPPIIAYLYFADNWFIGKYITCLYKNVWYFCEICVGLGWWVPKIKTNLKLFDCAHIQRKCASCRCVLHACCA